MTTRSIRSLLLLATGLALSTFTFAQRDIPANATVPTPQQLRYQQQELIGFLHFGVNTFSDREWGTGTENPASFNPADLDAKQWVEAAKAAGMKTLIITAKHHDGFCLWPTAQSTHSVKSSPWRDGKGDIVRELSDACKAAGIKLGIYLSPWDMHEPKYGTADYNQYYLAQLRDLLTNYGPVAELWMDGAKGENAKNMEYDFPAYRALIKQLQPEAVIFSDIGPGVRWIGNEKGFAGETCWSTINTEGMSIGTSKTQYLNTGDPVGDEWIPGECDVSIRPGWFYHAKEDGRVKTGKELVDIYYKSVGRNGTLLLNLPPNQRGLIHENDVAALREMRAILDETFQMNLAKGASAKGDSQWNGFKPNRLTDGDADSYWAAKEGQMSATLTLNLGQEKTFDRVMLQEPVRLGQRVAAFRIEAEQNGQWNTVGNGTTIGHKRLLRLPAPVTARRVRVVIEQANNTVALSEIGLFKASARE